jgi:hypothetical protein
MKTTGDGMAAAERSRRYQDTTGRSFRSLSKTFHKERYAKVEKGMTVLELVALLPGAKPTGSGWAWRSSAARRADVAPKVWPYFR